MNCLQQVNTANKHELAVKSLAAHLQPRAAIR